MTLDFHILKLLTKSMLIFFVQLNIRSLLEIHSGIMTHTCEIDMRKCILTAHRVSLRSEINNGVLSQPDMQ